MDQWTAGRFQDWALALAQVELDRDLYTDKDPKIAGLEKSSLEVAGKLVCKRSVLS